MTKREFLKTGLLATGGTLLAPTLALAGVRRGHIDSNSSAYAGTLFPYLWSEDLILLTHLTDLPEDISQALTVNQEFFHLGRSWQIPADEVKLILKESRELLAADENGLDRAKTQYALCAGWLAARYQEKQLETEDWPQDRRVGTDAHLLRVLHRGGAAGNTERLSEVSETEVLDLLRLVRQRNFLRLHTFRTEWEDIEGWLDGFLGMMNDLEAYDERLAAYYVAPAKSPLKSVRAYYAFDDPVVGVARSLRFGELTTLVGQRARISESAATSPYGRHLAGALPLMEATGSYVAGEVSAAELDRALASL